MYLFEMDGEPQIGDFIWLSIIMWLKIECCNAIYSMYCHIDFNARLNDGFSGLNL